MNHYTETTFLKKYPLSRKKLIKKMLASFCIFLFPMIGLGIIIGLSLISMPYINSTLAILLGIICPLIIVALPSYWYQKKYIETYFYNLTDKVLVIRKGVFAPQEITVPIDRIQDIYVDQDIFDRLLNIYDVHISTATAESTTRAHIDGVEKRIAEELRELILTKLYEARGKQL